MDLPEQFEQKLLTFFLLVNEKINRQFEDTYRDRLTTSQFYAVALLNDHGCMSMSALAKRMDIQKQQATKVANQLAGMGFLQRGSDMADRRITTADLTPRAKEYMASYRLENIKHISHQFTALPAEELARLEAAVDTINAILPQVAMKKKSRQSAPEDGAQKGSA